MSSTTDLAPVAVSVIIPVGSVDAALDRQVGAVVHQAGVNRFEVILAINAAESISVEDARRRWPGPDHVQLRVVPAPDRRGAAYTRNVGARAARGELLAFCDADDVVEPGWLQALTESLGERDAVTGRVIDVFPNARTAAWHPPATPGTLPSFLGREYLLSGNLGVHRHAFDVVGGFDESLTRCEDIAFGWALTGAGRSRSDGCAVSSVRPRRARRHGLWSDERAGATRSSADGPPAGPRRVARHCDRARLHGASLCADLQRR